MNPPSSWSGSTMTVKVQGVAITWACGFMSFDSPYDADGHVEDILPDLARLAATARDEVDMDKLTAALLGVVEETMQPEKVSLWLAREKGGRIKNER